MLLNVTHMYHVVEVYMYLLHIQMIILYKDPRGKRIFARTCTGTADSTIAQATNPLYGQRKESLSLKENCGNGEKIPPAQLKEQKNSI